MTQTGNRQVPWESSSLIGDFFFSGPAATDAGTAIPPLSQSQVDKEALFWQSVQDSVDTEDFEEYLRQFPGGIFAGLARNRIAVLRQQKPVESPLESPAATFSPTLQTLASVERPLKTLQEEVAVSAKGGITRGEAEPNNSYGKADRVPATGRISGRISPRGDADWYRIQLRHHGELSLLATDIADDIDLVFRVWNGEKHTVSSWFAPLRKGGETEGLFDAPAAGLYFIEVRDSRDDAASARPYSLNLSFRPSVDRLEPNNSFGAASQVTTGRTWKANILPKGDSDWYRFPVHRHGELKVLITRVPEDLDVSLRVWDSHKHAVSGWYTPLKAGGETEAVFDIPAPGSYFIEVRDGRDDARSIDPVDVSLLFRPSADSFEPNNDFGTATSVALGESVAAAILPKGDSDWYGFTVDEQGALDVAVTRVPPELDVSFRLWNAEKHAITNWYNPLKAGGDATATLDLKYPGRYALEVRDGRDDARSIDPYTLHLAFTPTQDLYEPNDSFGTASPIKLGAPVRGTILPRGDADWYRISTQRPGDLFIRITGIPPDLDIVVRAWNTEKHTISGWQSPLNKGGDTQGTVVLPAAGDYLLEVRDGRDDGRSIRPYTLRAGM